jgi:hypothetical protein
MSNSYGEITAFISKDCKFNGHEIAKKLNQYIWISHDDYFSWVYDEVSNKLLNKNAENIEDPSLFPEKIIKISVYKEEFDDYISTEFTDVVQENLEEYNVEESKSVSLSEIINDLSLHIYFGFIQLNLKSENYTREYSMLQQIVIKSNNCGTRVHYFYDKNGESGPSIENVINGELI